MTYTVETVGGTILATHTERYAAIADALARLEDDPEQGELHVARVEMIGCATHVPDADWQSVVAWVPEGEKITPPGPVPHRVTEDEFAELVAHDGPYADDWAKREGLRQAREDGLL